MVTYARQKAKKSQYLTADTATGQKILNYIRKRCEKALAYCVEQELTTVEDFAEALEQLTLSDGKPGISVEISKGGLTLTMTDHPELGSTTGKYMMQHLGFAEDEQKKFTVAGIETRLNPEPTQSNSSLNSLLDNLDDGESASQLKSQSTDELDDLLEEIDSSKNHSKPAEKLTKPDHQIKPKSRTNTKPKSQENSPSKQEAKTKVRTEQKNSKLDIDKILDSATQISAKVASQGSEIDGTTLGGMGTETAFLTTLVGKKAAHSLIKALQQAGKKRQIAQIINRLKAQHQRAEQLAERVEQLPELEENPPLETQESEDLNSEGTENVSETLARAVNQINQKITQTGISQGKSEKLTIDQKASFDQQLGQITAALNRIDQRLDNLESRIEALEQALADNPEINQPETKDKPLTISKDEIGTHSHSPDNLIPVFNKNNRDTSMSSPPKPFWERGLRYLSRLMNNDLSQECADTLLYLYNCAEEEALASGETVSDGVALGEDAILYASQDDDGITVNLETYSGELLFSAVNAESEWEIIHDLLSDDDKTTIINLPQTLEAEQEEELEPEIPQPRKKRRESEMEI